MKYCIITSHFPLAKFHANVYLIWSDLAGPVAQSVERWTPRGERTRPGKKGPVFEARQALDIYEPPGGYG